MDDEINKNTSGVQADNQSIAIGGITVGGDVSGNITIGTGYTSDQVSALITQIKSTFQPKSFDGRCPYKGLDVFEEDDAELFFGRETLVDDLVSRVKESRTVFITGPSGSGKSSLVRAGLIPALKQGKIHNSERWLYGTLKPGRDPLEALAAVFSRLKSPELGKYFREHAHEPTVLNECAESVLSERKDQRLVLFIDQFEEIFTQVDKEPERKDILALLTHAATVKNGRVIQLFSMRSDFVSNCATYPQLNALLNQQFVQIGAMQPEELVSAIAQPALRVGLRIDPDLIAQIINDMKGEPGALPLMQFALKDLFDAEQAKGSLTALTRAAYLERGGIHKSLERHADSVFATLSADEQGLARSVFSGLIEIGRGTQDTKRTALFDELVPANSNDETIKAIVQKLTDARLITIDESAGRDTVTISHEKLIDAWPWLKKLVNENRDVIALQNQIAADAKEWSEHQHDNSYLYSGARLAIAQEKIKDLVLSENAQTFLTTAKTVEENARLQSKQTQRRITTGLIVFSTIILGLFILSLIQIKISRAQQLGSQAQVALVKKDFSTALLYAYQSDLIYRNDAANLVLSQLVYENFSGAENTIHSKWVNTIAWSPDGILATGSDDGSISLWDLRKSVYPIKTLNGHNNRVTMVAWSQDGQLASSSWDGTVIVWNIKTGQPSKTLRGHKYTVSSVAWSANGQLASGAQDSTVIIWDINTGLPAQTLKGHTNTVTGVAWSATGQLASASADKTIIIWNLQTGEPAQILKGHTDTVRRVAWSADGKLASDSIDGTIILWDIKNSKPLQTILAFPDDIAWSAEGQLTFVSNEGHIVLWDPIKGQSVQTLSRQRYGGKLAWSLDGQLAASVNANDVVIQYPKTNLLARTLTGPYSNPVWSADGRLASDTVIWNLDTGQPAQTLNLPPQYTTTSMAWSADGRLASGVETLPFTLGNLNVIIWDLKTGNPIQILKGHTKPINSIAWSPDGQLASGSEDGTIIIWDLKTGQPSKILQGEKNDGYSSVVLAWSVDGRLASALNTNLYIWDLKTGKPVQVIKQYNFGSITSIAWSPNGQLASGSNYLGDLFEPNPNTVIVVIWDIKTGKPSRILQGQTGTVTSVAWSVNGDLASGSADKKNDSVVIWDLKTGKPFLTIRGVSSVAWSPIGQLASKSPDGLKITRPYIATDLCYTISRNMTIEEWLQYEGVLYIYRPACNNLYNPVISIHPANDFIKNISDIITVLISGDLVSLGGLLPKLLITWQGRSTLFVCILLFVGIVVFVLRIFKKSTAWLKQRLLSKRDIRIQP